MPTLPEFIERLLPAYRTPFLPPTTDPFGLILWEQVAYLVDDARRGRAFQLLADRVGLTPEAVLSAAPRALQVITRAGGATAAADRAERMRQSAELVFGKWEGDLGDVLALDLAGARRALQKFPMIGRPGADKILMLTRSHAVLALDSNGMRVLLRLGFGVEAGSYAATYRSVQNAAMLDGRAEFDWLIRAYGLLRMHGQQCCVRKAPHCDQCRLRDGCPAP